MNRDNKIPKVIHYCWFGGNELNKSAKKYIASWKKYFPEYEIKEWNELNYDVKKISYIRQAYEEKKYAFVSDYARFDILYHEGGVYFDTDVEVIKTFEDILSNGSFMGCEIDGPGVTNETIAVNPGLGMAAEKGLDIYKDILDFYNTQQFIRDDGSLNTETVVIKVTKILKEYGLKENKGIQKICDITIYPKEYFNPKDSSTGKLELTENTHSIHWYSMSWMSPAMRARSYITRIFHRLFGRDCFSFLRKR